MPDWSFLRRQRMMPLEDMTASSSPCPDSTALEALALAGEAAGDVRAHLATCDTCRGALERIRLDNQFLNDYVTHDGLAAASIAADGVIEIPGYECLSEIHRGGQGVVYHAVQRSTRREVAVKVMRQGPFATLADRARFDREIEILSHLDHPNLVTIHDAGVASGFHYFVMNFIDGKPLDESFADKAQATAGEAHRAGSALVGRRRRPPREVAEQGADALGAFIKICDAVHAAHLRGVIHRDLKPSNIRVDRAGEPFVLDFGLAKSTDAKRDSAMTRTGQFVGSLPWASPEQVEGAASIDLRTDVYSLGAILYQLLTGAAPFDVGSNLHDALDQILNRDPPRPSARITATGGARVDDELDTIVLKCLSKAPERRYQTAGELARDLRRYLAGEPIEAKSDSALYALRKTLRRHRIPVTFAAAFVALLAVFAVVMTLLYRRSAHLEQTASHSAASLSELLTLSNIEQGRMAGMLGNLRQAETFLWDELLMRRDPGTAGVVSLNAPPGPLEAYWALWELYRRNPCKRTLRPAGTAYRSFALINDGHSIWTGDSHGRIEELDLFGAPLRSDQLGAGPLVRPPLVSTLGDIIVWPERDCVRVWRRGEPQPIVSSERISQLEIGVIALSRSGRLYAAAMDGSVRAWRTDLGLELSPFEAPGLELRAVAISNDDQRVAALDQLGALHIWDVEPRRAVVKASAPASRPEIASGGGSLLFAPDGERIADSWVETAGRIWSLSTSEPQWIELADRPGIHREQAFSPDSALLAVGDLQGALRIFDAHTGELRRRFAAHADQILKLQFSNDSREVWTCANGDLRLWEVNVDEGTRVFRVPDELFYSVEIAPDDKTLFAGGRSGTLVRVDLASAAITREPIMAEGAISTIACSPDGRWRLAATYANALLLWDGQDPARDATRVPHPHRVSHACFSADSASFASACDDSVLRVWNCADASLTHEIRGPGGRMPQIAFDPLGGRIAASLRDGSLRVWELASGACEIWAPTGLNPLRTVAFAPDGRWLICGGAARTVDIWDARTRQRVASLAGHHQEIYALDISADSDLIASGDSGGVVRLWSIALQRPLATLDGHTGAVMAVRFSRDGRFLASASLDGGVRFHDLTYYSTHIAGNVAAQLRRIDSYAKDAERAAAWRRWGEATMRALATEDAASAAAIPELPSARPD